MNTNEILALAGQLKNKYIDDWKAEGRQVVGYSCAFTPVEVIEAAGIMPYRLRALGQTKTDIADAHLSRFNCSFCRSVLQLALNGAFDFLDGAIEANGCDHLRGMFENWQYVRPVSFFHYLKTPHIITDDAIEYFAQEIRKSKTALESHFSVSISDEQLQASIERRERIRDKLRELYNMRLSEKPALSGTEALALILLDGSIPAEDYEALLDDLPANQRHVPPFRARLLLGGSATDEIEFVRLIEDAGGLVVADTLCFGSRAFMPIENMPSDNPYKKLAAMYLKNLLCPRMFDDYPARLSFTKQMVDRSQVDGAVLVHNKFCDVHGIENVMLRKHLEESGLPVLTLEKEYGAAADLGRMKTRVQAFLERIEKS